MHDSVPAVRDRWRAAVMEVFGGVVDSDVFIWSAASMQNESGNACAATEMNERAHRTM